MVEFLIHMANTVIGAFAITLTPHIVIISSETTWLIRTKICRNHVCKEVLYTFPHFVLIRQKTHHGANSCFWFTEDFIIFYATTRTTNNVCEVFY